MINRRRRRRAHVKKKRRRGEEIASGMWLPGQNLLKLVGRPQCKVAWVVMHLFGMRGRGVYLNHL